MKNWPINRLNKALVVLFAFVAPVMYRALEDMHVTPSEAGLIASAVIVNFGVWFIKNTPQVPYAKTVVAILGVALTTYVAHAVDDVMTPSDWRAVVEAAGGAVLVLLVPNAKAPIKATPHVI